MAIVGHVPDVAVQVRVAGGEAERVLGGPAAGGRVEVAGAVGVQAGLGVELPRGEQDRVDEQRVELGHDVAEVPYLWFSGSRSNCVSPN